MQGLRPHKRSQNRATVEAVIFDLDGSIIDSNDFHVEAWNRAFQHFGKHFPIDALRAQIGKGSDQYLPEFLTPDELQKIGRKIDEYRSALFRKEYLPRVKAFPKARELFERIKADDRRIALATSSKKDDVKTYTKVAQIVKSLPMTRRNRNPRRTFFRRPWTPSVWAPRGNCRWRHPV